MRLVEILCGVINDEKKGSLTSAISTWYENSGAVPHHDMTHPTHHTAIEVN